jgi:hypothetical protein
MTEMSLRKSPLHEFGMHSSVARERLSAIRDIGMINPIDAVNDVHAHPMKNSLEGGIAEKTVCVAWSGTDT